MPWTLYLGLHNRWIIMIAASSHKVSNFHKRKKNGERPLNVMFGDLNYFNRQTVHNQYVPLGIGLIAQYAKQQFGDDISVSLFKDVDKFLNQAAQNPPDVVGLSIYYWNIAKSQYLIKCLREKFGRDIIIVIGGPTFDSDEAEQRMCLIEMFPDADAICINEGEIGFSNVIRKILENRKTVFKDHIEGVSFLDGNNLVQGFVGNRTGLSMDLETMGSPYLSGLLDEFMNSDNQPLVQTSRSCPYSCTFCVAGKNRGKLRGSPIEQVIEEARYISKRYADRPQHTFWMSDDNFGILERDIEIAKAIRKCKEDFGYPQSVAFFNDKRFTDISRKILEILKDQTQRGVVLALQTENPDTLKAIDRRNVTAEQIDDAIIWAKGLDLNLHTDLIFGMPHETQSSFIDVLDRTIKRGFDNVIVLNLLLLPGTEMYRQAYRKKYNIKTKYRIVGTYYGKQKDTFLAEHEEVAVSSNSYTYEEFLNVRYLGFMFYPVYNFYFNKWFFQYAKDLGIFPSKFFARFVKPDLSKKWPQGYIRFLEDLKKAIEGEIFDTREEMVAAAKKMYEANGNDVGESSRIAMNFGARLSYLEGDWTKEVLMIHLEDFMEGKLSEENRNLAGLLIDLSERERVNLRKIGEKKPLKVSFDVINWKKNKFRESLNSLKIPEKCLKFTTEKSQSLMIEGVQKRFASYNDIDYYHAAMESIRPRAFMLHNLSYE